ncbi:hypothetical protein IV203_000617 [Nitzschia inconspicua]|uniref:Uncharacterized protein n=1 Tax=Nitzschia inconspicua TaxID=303405 RepID=A0A9K3PQV0_9STRA|nr:hypothetical protein IV203_000617 [Nitzschia inconspicua]
MKRSEFEETSTSTDPKGRRNNNPENNDISTTAGSEPPIASARKHTHVYSTHHKSPLNTALHPPSSRTLPLHPASAATTSMAPRNPFHEHIRNNFPDFEVALKPGSMSYAANIFDDDDDDDDARQQSLVDHSVCSAGNSSILNMSIGARAALNEHLRHIAKYGIDGEKGDSGSCNSSDDRACEGEEDRSPPPCPSTHSLLDEHWENLLDISSRVNLSGEAGSVGEGIFEPTTPSVFEDAFPLHENLMYVASNEVDGDGIEVMTDLSHDFFNSSRVKLLATPERNQNRRLDMVVTRGADPVDALLFDNGSFIHDEPSSFEATNQDRSTSDFLITGYTNLHDSGIFHPSEHVTRITDLQNTTAHSFNPGDISEVRRSPNTSFLSQEHHLELDGETNAETATDPNTLRAQDFSYLSSPNERELQNLSLRRGAGDDSLQKSFPLASPSAISLRRSPRRRLNLVKARSAQHKENVSPEVSSSTSHSKNTGSSLQSVVSSFIDEAKSMAAYMANELEHSFGGFESLPTEFLRALDISGGNSNRNDPPSPISQADSNHSSSHESAKRKSDHGLNIRSNVLSQKETTFSGRQHFRTVVPRRIYGPPANNESGEEQDSFLAVCSNPETHRDGKKPSLVDSFDGAAKRITF